MRCVAVVLAVLVGCGGGGGGDNIDGSVDADIDEYDARWMMTPTRCVSGEHQGFFGVDLLQGDDQSTLLRVLLDPVEGYSLGTNVPGEDVALFIDANTGCETFDLAAVRQNSRFNGYWNVEGHAVVDCSLPGFELHADISFVDCH